MTAEVFAYTKSRQYQPAVTLAGRTGGTRDLPRAEL